jgi:hypothetical protein
MESYKMKKREVCRIMAQRVCDGEFKTAYEAANCRECAELGICQASILRCIDKLNPAEAAARDADRARVNREKAAAHENAEKVNVIYVERGGAASAETAAKKSYKKLQREASKKLKGIINLADDAAQAAHQAGLEAGADEARGEFEGELKQALSNLSRETELAKSRLKLIDGLRTELGLEKTKRKEAEAEATTS